MQPIRFLSCLLCCICSVGTAFAQNLKYNIQIEPREAKEMRISVDLECYHSDRDTIYIGILPQINQLTQLHRQYRNWNVKGGLIVKKDSTRLTIKVTDKKSPLLKIHYDIFSPFTDGTLTPSNSPGPLLQPDYLHIRGYTLLLSPLHYKSFDVEVNWEKLPKGWKIQNSFGFDSKQQRFQSNNRDNWQRTNWIAGNFRQYSANVYGKPVCFALRGKWYFEDTTLFNVILKTVQTQREQWDDRDIDFYSVTLMPYQTPEKASDSDKKSQYIGNGLYQSFVAYADESTLLAAFVDLFNHEMMHEWIGGRINEGKATETIDMRWFVEGFTEYFALRNRWKAGFVTTSEFFEELNTEYFVGHYSSPYAEVPNLEAGKKRWTSHEMDRVPYRRGCIAAFYLDMAIRQKSKEKRTLFNMLNDLMDYTYGTKRNLTDSYDFFVETLGEYYQEDPTNWLDKYIDEGKKIPANAFVLPNYIQLKNNSGTPQFMLNPAVKNAEAMFFKD